jgi:hypothetical protein
MADQVELMPDWKKTGDHVKILGARRANRLENWLKRLIRISWIMRP